MQTQAQCSKTRAWLTVLYSAKDDPTCPPLGYRSKCANTQATHAKVNRMHSHLKYNRCGNARAPYRGTLKRNGWRHAGPNTSQTNAKTHMPKVHSKTKGKTKGITSNQKKQTCSPTSVNNHVGKNTTPNKAMALVPI